MSEPTFTPPAEDFEPPPEAEPLPEPKGDDLPEHAHDQDGAQARAESPRRDPQVPGDQDTPPPGMDDYGTTPGGQRRSDTLDDRLAREEPDSVGEPPD